MATLGTSWTNIASGSFSSGGATLTYYIDAKLSSQSIANNQSTVDTRARTVFSGNYMGGAGYSFSCTGCSTSSGSGVYWYSTETVLTGSITVSHADDGTKTFSMSGACTNSYLGMNISISGSIALPTIARASKPTTSASSLTMGGSLTINTNRKSSSFTHTIKVTCGGNSVTYTNVGTSQSFTATASTWMPYMTSKSMTVTVSCTTYNGSTQIGSVQSCSFTLNVDTTVYKPVISAVTHEDTNADTVALTGNSATYVRAKSILSLSASLTVNNSDYGSTLKSAVVQTTYGTTQSYTLSGTSQSISFTANGITSPTITVTVTDNRGVTATQTINLTLVPYDVPKLSAIEIKRVNANDQESETGVYLKYKLTSTVFWGSFGQVNNTLKVYSRYKVPSASSYSAWTLEDTISTSGTAQYKSYEVNGTCAGTYSSSSQFDVQIMVADELGSAYLYAKVLEGIPVFAWGSDHFDIYGSLHIHDRESVNSYLAFDIDSIETVPVTFSGANGGTVNWAVFKFGSLRIATCKWTSASNYAIGSAWSSVLTSANISTPNFPLTFADVLYQNIKYVAADSAVSADCWNSIKAGALSNTNAGTFFLVRPNDNGTVTVNHPVFTMLVIGTV